MMIIDDEPLVRAGMKQLIEWENYNLEICAEGIDGVDGLEKILHFMPDLILVDVKMPGMNGIEVIREARKAKFEGKFIILTGYSDFEFAKSAVSLGVRAYLLKPIDEDELLENVIEVLAELDAKKNLDDYYSLSELKARQEVLQNLLMNTKSKDVLRREIKLYGMDYNYHCFSVAILSNREAFARNDLSINQDMKEIILNNLENVDTITLDDKLVLINKGCTYQELLQKLVKNNERIKGLFGESFFIAIGHNVSYLEDLYFSYECAKLLSEYEFLYKDKEAVSIDILNSNMVCGEGNFTNKLCGLIEIGDIDEISLTISDMKEYYKLKLMKESDIKVYVIHNIILLHSMLLRKYEQKKNELPNYELLIEEIKKAESMEELMEMVSDFCIDITVGIDSSTMDNVVKKMFAYMEKNYNQDLKLENIAKIFNYNSAYLGKIFKKEMKESFNNILDTIRIDNAKRLLLQSDLKVYQISEQVGYGNIDYFYSKFKKNVGYSPKEFRANKL